MSNLIRKIRASYLIILQRNGPLRFCGNGIVLLRLNLLMPVNAFGPTDLKFEYNHECHSISCACVYVRQWSMVVAHTRQLASIKCP